MRNWLTEKIFRLLRHLRMRIRNCGETLQTTPEKNHQVCKTGSSLQKGKF